MIIVCVFRNKFTGLVAFKYERKLNAPNSLKPLCKNRIKKYLHEAQMIKDSFNDIIYELLLSYQ